MKDFLKTLHFPSLLLCFLLIFLAFSFQSALNQRLQDILQSHDGIGHEIWFLASFQIILSILGEALVFLALFSGLFHSRISKTLAQTKFSELLNQLLIEICRSWGHVLRGFLLFLIPGFLRMIKLFFVPYIILSSSRYWRGEIDVLEESKKITQGLPFSAWTLVLSLKIIFPLILGLYTDGNEQIWITPLATLIGVVLEFLLALITVYLVFQVFDRESLQKESL